MKPEASLHAVIAALSLALLAVMSSRVQAQSPPDLTSSGAIAALKADTNANPRYNETYNLGPTGLRGWIYVGGGSAADGTFTDASRQILVTVASSPANAVLAVDDVILGAMAASSGTVPLFSSDCRKAFGTAIGDAEKTGAGTLRVKRWRTGNITDVNIPITILGNYTATAPYSCPKSSMVLTNARNKLVGQLLADANFFNRGERYSRPIHGLALLAGVAPGDPDHAAVHTRLQTYARAMATAGPQQGGIPTWDWAYSCLFLAEYYLSTNDANVLPGIATFVNQLVQSQSIYGTFGHDPAAFHPDGSGRLISTGYGPVNSVAIIANMGIFMSKKALVAGGQTINPNIDPALQRASDFFAWYVNKGSIPYGEHGPWLGNHESNGKDPMCAVFFGLQPNRTVEAEYFTRMSISGFNSRESGHTGQGFSYLWGAMGANMGGSLATAEYLKNVRCHLDLSRRTDGSFAYDGREGHGPGSTADGTYLGASGYNDLNPTASYLLTYSLPLQRLYITGKNANPANTLDTAKVTHAVASATFKQQSPSKTNSELITALSDFDPIVRNYAAIELGKRSPSAGELTTLRGMVTSADANSRMGACQALGLLKDSAALSLINDRLDKTIESNSWVRAQAANAIRQYPSATISPNRDALLSRFTANATDPGNIDWDDPLQAANNSLSLLVFGNGVPDGTTGNDIAAYTINAPKNLLYPAITAGLKQPDSYPRTGVSQFCHDRLTLADVQELVPDLFKLAKSEGLADRMWGAPARALGINTLAKYKISEGIPVALSMLEVPAGFTWDAANYINPALNAMASYGDAARWTLPTLNNYLNTWSPQDTSYPSQAYPTLINAAATIENAITSPAQNPGLAVANSQVVSTTGAKAITLTGASPRSAVTFTNVTAPTHGTLTGTAPNLVYTPDPLYSGPDSFTFQVVDSLGVGNPSAPGTVSIIVGNAGKGLNAEYFDNADFSNPKLTRTDVSVNFDWGSGSPDALVGPETFSARWSGLLLVPETGNYRFSTLNSDGVRLFVNGVLVLDQYADQSTNWNDSTSIALNKGQLVDLHLLYYENTGSAVAKLKWTGPSFAGANGAIIGKEWLFSGAGLVFTPYAHPQSISVPQNTPQPVTLSGSGGTLTYTVVAPPTNGALTGVAPNLTYTPNNSFNGTDSFTFRVNNGSGDSAPATVTIAISSGPAVGFTWLNPTAGNMSAGGNWTSGIAPAAGGQPTYQLNFTPSGTYTVTHNLNNGFQLNQLNTAGEVTLAGTNSLAFTANGFLLPQINQNSASAVTLDTPLSLAAMTTSGGTGSGQVTMTQLVSGAGGLTKDGAGVLQIHGVTQNTFSGGTIINSGLLILGAVIDSSSPVVTNPLGTGPVTLNGGTIEFNRVTASNSLTVNGGTFDITNGWGATWSGPISGAGTLAKSGVSTVTLSGNNSSFSGVKQVNEGILSFTARTAVGTGAIHIATGAKVNLTYSTTSTNIPKVNGLTLGGVVKVPGTYGSTSSTATFKDDTWFSGSGRIQVLTTSATALSLTSGASPAAPGTSLTFRATVTGSSPVGSVSFYDGTTLLGTATLSSGQASFTTTALASGTRAITALYAGNTANAPSTSSALAIVILPSAPTIFSPSASSYSVNLAWTQPGGSTGYRVKRSLTSGGPYTLVANLVANQFVDTTVSDGTQYFYVVSALSGTGEGNNSAQVSISTPVNLAPVFPANPIILPNGVAQSAYFGQTLDGLATDGSDAIVFSKVSGPSWLSVAADGSLSGTPPFGSNGPNSFVVRATDNGSLSSDATLQITVLPPPNPACQLGILNLNANGGINPATNAAWTIGDKYRLAFVTRASTQATSTDIATYNTFVQNVANSSTLNLGGATWKIIGSTATLDARDNTSTNPNANGTGEAIFLVNGTTRIADNYADLWNNSINSAINLDERGTLLQPSSYVFAGTLSNGTKDTGFTLGITANNQQVGSTAQTNAGWIRIWNASATSFLPVYALSDSLTIIDDIDTALPTLTSITDNRSGGPIITNTSVNYTVTFSEDMHADSVSADDFGNAGNSAITIGAVAETSPGVFTVPVTPTSAGTLRLRINASSVLHDAAGNAMDTSVALADDTTLTVTPPNTAPVANAQSVSTAEDTAQSVNLTGSDADGNPLTYHIVTNPAHGTLGGTAPNVTYTPAANYFGSDNFTFKVNDGTVDSAAATVSITVTAVNDPPVATPQLVSTVQSTTKSITLAGADLEGNSLTYAIVTNPTNGTLGGTAPNVTYNPASNYLGPDSFTFKVNDGITDSAPATVSITVGVNGQITWGAATAITGGGNIQSAGLTNLAGANFGITTGTTTLVPASETGTVGVEFRSLRSGQNATLSNGINVAADATWGNWGFAAANSTVSGNFGTVLDSNLGIETNVPVSPSATITLSNLTVGARYRFQLFADSTGSNSQTISGSVAINSQNGQFVTGTFTADATSRVLTVTRNTDFAVVNALTIGTVDTTPPTLASSSIVDNKGGGPVTVNTLVTYTVTFSKDMDASTVSAADFGNTGTSAITIGAVTETSPTSGVFTVPVTPTSTGTLRLRVNAGAVLNDAASNALVTTTAIVDDTTITIANTPPVANVQGVSTAEDTTKGITLTGSDVDGNSLTFAIVSPPANGSLSGTAPNVTYTPAANFNGPDSFTFKVNDGTVDSAPATVSITVTAVNDAPGFTTDPFVGSGATQSVAYSGSLVGSAIDPDQGDTLIFTKTGGPAWLTVGGDGTLGGTPGSGDVGLTQFTVRATDGGLLFGEATLRISVLSAYESWILKFPGANLADPNSDNDHDGLSNFEEWVWGLDPTNANSPNPISVPLNPKSGVVSYTRPDPLLTGISYSVWTSNDLLNWNEDSGAVQTPDGIVNDVQTVTVTLSPGFRNLTKLFVQVRGTK